MSILTLSPNSERESLCHDADKSQRITAQFTKVDSPQLACIQSNDQKKVVEDQYTFRNGKVRLDE